MVVSRRDSSGIKLAYLVLVLQFQTPGGARLENKVAFCGLGGEFFRVLAPS